MDLFKCRKIFIWCEEVKLNGSLACTSPTVNFGLLDILMVSSMKMVINSCTLLKSLAQSSYRQKKKEYVKGITKGNVS